MTTWDAVLDAVGLALSGERERGRAELLACWRASEDEPAQRCVLAHHLADLEDHLDDEGARDQRALDARAQLDAGLARTPGAGA